MSNGVIYSAYGKSAIEETIHSIRTLNATNSLVASCVITDNEKAFKNIADHIIVFKSDPFGRWAKLNADVLTPFKYTLYLDADTRIRGDLSILFSWLQSGFEMIHTLSARQQDEWAWQVPEDERLQSLEAIGHIPVQYQAGVWGFRRTPALRSLMSLWRKEWEQMGNKHDQAALSRAMRQKPVKTLLISHDFNGGSIIQHLFGRAQR